MTCRSSLGQAFGSGQRRDCRLKGDLCVAECNALGTHSIKFPAPKGCSTVIQSSGLKCRYRAHEFAGQLPGALPPATKIQAYSLPSRADSGASPESFSPASSNHALGRGAQVGTRGACAPHRRLAKPRVGIAVPAVRSKSICWQPHVLGALGTARPTLLRAWPRGDVPINTRLGRP